MADNPGGFECEFIKIPPKAVQSECPVCLQVLREPYQATCCGYSFCRVCIERSKARNIPCPCCKADEFDLFPNKGLQRSLYEFQVKCINKDLGCQWAGELGQLDKHLNLKPVADKQLQGCQFTQIQCLYCSQLFQRSSIQTHQDEQCPKRSFCCDYCGEFESTYEDVTTNHWPVCRKYLVPCPNNCGETLQHQNIENHTREECPLTIQDCNFKHVGCEVRLARKDMPEHLTKDLVRHVSLLTASHKRLEEENKQLKIQVVKLEQSVQELTTNSEPTCVDFVMNNFNQHKKDKDIWLSPSFYSHPRGYKMCLAVYANGVGEGEGTHVSVFVYIRRGEYDNILRWPFQGTIPICVFGQELFANLPRMVVCTTTVPLERVIEGDRSKNGFGIPQFIPHSTLNSYLRNDSLHFRISQISVTVADQ